MAVCRTVSCQLLELPLPTILAERLAALRPQVSGKIIIAATPL
jgi:hypothetical protein